MMKVLWLNEITFGVLAKNCVCIKLNTPHHHPHKKTFFTASCYRILLLQQAQDRQSVTKFTFSKISGFGWVIVTIQASETFGITSLHA